MLQVQVSTSTGIHRMSVVCTNLRCTGTYVCLEVRLLGVKVLALVPGTEPFKLHYYVVVLVPVVLFKLHLDVPVIIEVSGGNVLRAESGNINEKT